MFDTCELVLPVYLKGLWSGSAWTSQSENWCYFQHTTPLPPGQTWALPTQPLLRCKPRGLSEGRSGWKARGASLQTSACVLGMETYAHCCQKLHSSPPRMETFFRTQDRVFFVRVFPDRYNYTALKLCRGSGGPLRIHKGTGYLPGPTALCQLCAHCSCSL